MLPTDERAQAFEGLLALLQASDERERLGLPYQKEARDRRADDVAAEVRISLGDREPAIDHGERRLAVPGDVQQGDRERVEGAGFGILVARLFGQLESFFERRQGLREPAGRRARHAVLHQQAGFGGRVRQALTALLALGKERLHFLVASAQAGTAHDHVAQRLASELEELGRLGQGSDQGQQLLPVTQRLVHVVVARPVGGAAVPTGRFQRLVGLFPVVRDQRGLLVQTVAAELFRSACDGRVDAPSLGGELRLVRDLLRERVLERVLGLGIQRLLEDELRADQVAERRRQLLLVQPGDESNRRLREALADYGSGSQHSLLSLFEAIDACRQDRSHRGSDLDLCDRLDESVAAARALEGAFLDEKLDELFDEEGVALGALVDPFGQTLERGVATEQVAQQLVDGLGRQRREGKLVVLRAALEGRPVLGPKVEQEKRARVGYDLDERIDEGLGGAVDPMEILDQDDRGALGAARVHQARDDAEDAALANFRIDGGRWVVWVGHAQELEELGELFSKAGVQANDAARDLVACGLVAVLILDVEVTAQKLEHRQVGDVSPV